MECSKCDQNLYNDQKTLVMNKHDQNTYNND